MKKLKLLTFSPLIFGATIMALAACTQKRPDQWAQNQGEEYTEAFPEFHGKTFPLKTGHSLVKSNTATSQKFVVEKGVKEFNNMDFVSYKTTAKLMPKDIEFRGRPNWKYQVLYKVTKNYLKVFKVGPVNDIPFQERTYAEKLEDGRLAIPLVGYPIDHIRRVKALDRNNNETHQWIGIRIQNPEGDSLFRINKKDYVRFEALTKNEVFPVDFLGINENEDSDPKNDRHWLYAETILESNNQRLNAEGGLGIFGVDNDWTLASKIKFVRPTDKEIRAVNSTAIQGVDRTQLVNSAPVLTIPARYIDYRLQPKGSEDDMREIFDERKHFKERRYVQLRLGDTQNFYNKRPGSKLDEVIIGQHKDGRRYFSYTLTVLGDEKTRVRVKYSFLEDKRDNKYETRFAFQDDMKTFGSLTRRLKTEKNFRIKSKRDHDLRRVVTRFGLSKSNRTITFNIAEETKRRYLPLARKSIEVWNRALEHGKVNLRLALDETPVALGDIRYNVLHFNDNYYSAWFLGVAANQVDPDTGEIFSTTSIVSLSSLVDSNSGFIENYLRYKLGYFEKSDIETFLPMSQANPTLFSAGASSMDRSLLNPLEDDKGRDLKFSFTASNPFSPFVYENNGRFTPISGHPLGVDLNPSDQPKEARLDRIDYNQVGRKRTQALQREAMKNEGAPFRCSFGSVGGNLINRIEKLCQTPYNPTKTSLMAYLKQLEAEKASGDFTSAHSFDREIIEDCANKISFHSAISVAVHEIGHSIGLDHNFMGTADKANFYKTGDTKTSNDHIQSSSIMDYTNLFDPTLMVPGRYDIAMARYLYDDQVEMKDGTLSNKLDVNRSIEDQLGRGMIRPYMYCGNLEERLQLNPFCRKFDHGTTPIEIVDHWIAQYQSWINAHTYRYDRRHFWNGQSFGWVTSEHFFVPLKNIYDKWRHLLREKVGMGAQYLESFEADTFQTEVLDAMKTDSKFAKRYNLWRPAAERVMNFFLNELAFAPDKYCVGELAPGTQPVLVELEDLMHSANVSRDDRIYDCRHPAITSLMATRGLTLIDEVGHPIHDTRFAQDELDVTKESVDIVGLGNSRLNAFWAMVMRSPWYIQNNLRGFYPSMMDEPDFRKKIWDRVSSRLLNGVTLKKYPNAYFEKYLHEDAITSTFSFMYKMGIGVPEKPEVFLARITKHRGEIIPEEMSAARPDPVVGISVAGGTATLGIYNTENSETLRFLREYMRLKNAETSEAVDPSLQAQLQPMAQYISSSYPAATVGDEPSFLDYLRFIKMLVDTINMTVLDPNLKKLVTSEFNLEFNFFEASGMQDLVIDQYDQHNQEVQQLDGDLYLKREALAAEKRKGEAADQELIASLKAEVDKMMGQLKKLQRTGGTLELQIQLAGNSTSRDQVKLNHVVSKEDMLTRIDNMIALHNRAVQLHKTAPAEAKAKQDLLFKEIIGFRIGNRGL